jgi:hypothetical protein
LRFGQQARQFLDLSRGFVRSSPSQFGSIVAELPLLRGYPLIEGNQVLAMKMLEREIGDGERDDPRQANRFWCSPDHTRVRYGTIGYPSEKTVLHFQLHLGDWRPKIWLTQTPWVHGGVPHSPWDLRNTEVHRGGKCANRGAKNPEQQIGCRQRT